MGSWLFVAGHLPYTHFVKTLPKTLRLYEHNCHGKGKSRDKSMVSL